MGKLLMLMLMLEWFEILDPPLRSPDVFHKNKLPYICSMYDTGFKVLSININYLAPFKHKHKHQKFAHEN
jgi:hypothetical protein